MAGIAGTCSTGLVFKTKESCSNKASLFQHNGLRAVEKKQLGSSGFKPNRFISTSGFDHSFHFAIFSIFLNVIIFIPH